jgi:hypothetical protein
MLTHAHAHTHTHTRQFQTREADSICSLDLVLSGGTMKIGSSWDVVFQRTTQHYIPEDRTLHNHQCENLKSYTAYCQLPAWLSTWLWRWTQWIPPKCSWIPTEIHGITYQKTVIFLVNDAEQTLKMGKG